MFVPPQVLSAQRYRSYTVSSRIDNVPQHHDRYLITIQQKHHFYTTFLFLNSRRYTRYALNVTPGPLIGDSGRTVEENLNEIGNYD